MLLIRYHDVLSITAVFTYLILRQAVFRLKRMSLHPPFSHLGSRQFKKGINNMRVF